MKFAFFKKQSFIFGAFYALKRGNNERRGVLPGQNEKAAVPGTRKVKEKSFRSGSTAIPKGDYKVR
ncbi:MAG: hypothetical protein IKM52_06015 [Clostridia bacterium]|nr:hypothetical protein [Clostridia bacterium]